MLLFTADEICQVTVYSLNGRKILAHKFPPGDCALQLDIAHGLYIVEVWNTRYCAYQKIRIEE
ncbi:MAG: T9SS type A sorting domain-containing protein [Chitinivibrionales bacterium]|nr:T9SS type A sorting domain-containing protein [Chitinivibrionales bacterium]